MRLITILVIAFVSIGASCEKKPVVLVPEDTHKCPDACENLRQLGCEEGEDLADGTTCEQFCEETQKSGHALNPTCIATISSCDEIESKCMR